MIYINGRFLTQSVTGVQRFAIQILLRLIEIRNDIIVICPKSTPDNELTQHLNVEKVGIFSGHAWEQLELPFYMRGKQGLLLNFCNTAPMFFSKNIVVHHDITYKRYPKSYSVPFRLFYSLMSPLILCNSEGIVTVSNFSKGEIEKEYGVENIAVVYNAVSDIFYARESAEKNYLLCVSSPSYHKNFSVIIDCFEEIHHRFGLKLIIIGAANNNFSSLSSLSHIDDENIELRGRVSDDELAQLYSGAFAFVYPSLYEGFGIPVIEAQSCHCPVISSDRASLPEVLCDSALFFDPLDSSSLIQQVSELYNNNMLRASLIKRGLSNVSRFSWKKSAKDINTILDNYIKDKSRSDL